MSFNLDGVYKNSNYISTSHSSVQTTSSSANTFITLIGSEINYSPSQNAANVIYEISFYGEQLGKPFIVAQLEHYTSGAWSEINEKYRRNFGLGNATLNGRWNRFPIYWRFILPAWSGEKSLRIRLGSPNANNEMDLHQISSWDGTYPVTNRFCNTNLFIYSI